MCATHPTQVRGARITIDGTAKAIEMEGTWLSKPKSRILAQSPSIDCTHFEYDHVERREQATKFL